MIEIMDYEEDVIQRLWKDKIRRSGSVYLSKASLAETDQYELYKFLKKNDYELMHTENGAFMRKIKIEF